VALFASCLVLLCLLLASPGWLQLAGMSPAWAVLWLLPWSVVEGPLAGALAGIAVGLLFDALQGSNLTSVPMLALLGFWWGQFLAARRPLERSTTLGLLALIGTLLLNGSYALQLHLRGEFNSAAWHITFAQTLLTALVAPLFCSLQVLFWRRISSRYER
jgi:rod shape-determining protein MreD